MVVATEFATRIIVFALSMRLDANMMKTACLAFIAKLMLPSLSVQILMNAIQAME
jgi:hypothetical protein